MMDLRRTTTGRVSNPPLPGYGLVTLQFYDVEPLFQSEPERVVRTGLSRKMQPRVHALRLPVSPIGRTFQSDAK